MQCTNIVQTLNIGELKANMKKVNVEGTVFSLGEKREVTLKSTGDSALVRDMVLEDPTGQVKVSLWGDQADMFEKGDRVGIENGYVTEWKSQLQLSIGKFGTVEKLVVQ